MTSPIALFFSVQKLRPREVKRVVPNHIQLIAELGLRKTQPQNLLPPSNVTLLAPERMYWFQQNQRARYS